MFVPQYSLPASSPRAAGAELRQSNILAEPLVALAIFSPLIWGKEIWTSAKQRDTGEVVQKDCMEWHDGKNFLQIGMAVYTRQPFYSIIDFFIAAFL